MFEKNHPFSDRQVTVPNVPKKWNLETNQKY
jgi:hypothetical protein